MIQKTIWKDYLFFGISLLLLISLTSCEERVEYIKTVSYVYKNDTETDLILEIYNTEGIFFRSFNIPSNGSVETNTTREEGPAIFYFDSTTDSIGTSVIVRFSDNKCLYYPPGNGLNDISDAREYDNYSEELIGQRVYTLYYTFTEEYYDMTINCI